MAIRLTIELVPAGSWHSNLRSIVPGRWDDLRRRCYMASEYRCEICNGRGPNHPVECHERWEYDDDRHIQKLVGLIALCPACHEVKHMGLARVNGNERRAKRHLTIVNGWTSRQASQYIDEAFNLWRERSVYDWHTDISWINSVA